MLTPEFWKKYLRHYDILNLAIPYQDFLDALIKEVDPKSGDLILDAGCGTGNFEWRLRNNYPEIKAQVIGLANSPNGLAIYKQKMPDAQTVLADLAETLPFGDNYFDKIISFNALYAVDHNHRSEVLREIYRVLKPGGVLVLANFKYGWSPFEIYKETVRRELKLSGFSKMLSLMFRTAIPSLKIFYYNYELMDRGYFGNCRFMDEEEQIRKLTKAGFKNINEDQYVYAGQVIMNRAEK